MIQFELESPVKEILEYADAIPEAKQAGLKRLAEAAQKIAERKVGDIRKRRVPTKREVALYNQSRRSGKKRRITADNSPAWQPTGDLLRAVQAEPVLEGEDTVILTADTEYAAARHDLGTPAWMPANPALGVVRKDAFFGDTATIIDPMADNLFADGFNDFMESR